jgi:hypothetical protein
MKFIVAIFWIITMPLAMFKVSYDCAVAWIEFKVEEELDVL